MHDHDNQNTDQPLRVGSLFSGYGGLDLAVETVFGARTIWFSEINEPVARVFSHHWPGVPNLGDITAIDWSTVPPVDVLCGGFPCQDVSTVGKRAGLKPGTRSGLWSHMAAAIEALHPRWVEIENVRGLLTAPAVGPTDQGADDDQRNPDTPSDNATTSATVRGLESDPWGMGNQPTRPLTAAGAVLVSLASLGFDAAWVGLPASAVGAAHARFRVFILAWPRQPGGESGPCPSADTVGVRLDQGQRTDPSRQGTARDDHLDSPDCGPGTERAARETGRLRDAVRGGTGLPYRPGQH